MYMYDTYWNLSGRRKVFISFEMNKNTLTFNNVDCYYIANSQFCQLNVSKEL